MLKSLWSDHTRYTMLAIEELFSVEKKQKRAIIIDRLTNNQRDLATALSKFAPYIERGAFAAKVRKLLEEHINGLVVIISFWLHERDEALGVGSLRYFVQSLREGKLKIERRQAGGWDAIWKWYNNGREIIDAITSLFASADDEIRQQIKHFFYMHLDETLFEAFYYSLASRYEAANDAAEATMHYGLWLEYADLTHYHMQEFADFLNAVGRA